MSEQRKIQVGDLVRFVNGHAPLGRVKAVTPFKGSSVNSMVEIEDWSGQYPDDLLVVDDIAAPVDRLLKERGEE